MRSSRICFTVPDSSWTRALPGKHVPLFDDVEEEEDDSLELLSSVEH
jgi:hypothetical protein